jgi:hypothetical protein
MIKDQSKYNRYIVGIVDLKRVCLLTDIHNDCYSQNSSRTLLIKQVEALRVEFSSFEYTETYECDRQYLCYEKKYVQ